MIELLLENTAKKHKCSVLNISLVILAPFLDFIHKRCFDVSLYKIPALMVSVSINGAIVREAKGFAASLIQ